MSRDFSTLLTDDEKANFALLGTTANDAFETIVTVTAQRATERRLDGTLAQLAALPIAVQQTVIATTQQAVAASTPAPSPAISVLPT